MAFEYIDRCVEMMRQIDPSSLGKAATARKVGSQGSEHDTYALANIESAPTALAVKVRHWSLSSVGSQRLLRELPLVSLLTERLPELMETVPAFMGQLVVGGNALLLTEDVTEGGVHSIRSIPVSEGLLSALESAFCSDQEGIYEIFYRNVLHRNMAFSAAGRERWLDFTPAPMNYNNMSVLGIDEHRDYVAEMLPSLSLVTPAHSSLRSAFRLEE